MILYIMLVALGFLTATLLALVLAPSFWRRAERLTTRRLEQSMPMSIAETEADRDQLRASYAIIIRRLEAALSQEKMRSARQLVKISRLQMEIANLSERTAQLNSQLEAEHNAASVLRRTIATRVPELNRAAEDAKQLVHVRDREMNTIVNRLRHREESLAIAQRTTDMQQAEIGRLRQAMEMSGAQNAGRFKLRPTQWSIHDYRAEYDRLNVELSKLRERLSVAYDREANHVTQLRTELQQLADQIVTAAVSLPKGEQQRAIADDRAESEPGEARGTGADSREMDAVMRSIDAIIAGDTAPATGAPVPAATDRAPARAGLSRGVVARMSDLAEATRSVVASAVSGGTEAGGEESAPPKPGRVSAAKLLGGAAVPERREAPQARQSTSRADADGIASETPAPAATTDGAAVAPSAPPSRAAASEPATDPVAASAPDVPGAEDAGKAAETPAEQPVAEAGTPADVGGSLYDQIRSDRPVSGGLTDEAGAAEPASERKDAPGSAAAEEAEEEEKGAAETNDKDADTSASSLLNRLKQVPENQTR